MGLIQINTAPSRRQLNQFGFVWLGFLILFGAIAYFRFNNQTLAMALWVLAAVVPVIGWLLPPFMRLVFVGMSIVAWPIGFVVSHVVLALVYYLVFTPVGLIMRLVGYDSMRRRSDSAADSYWLSRDPGHSEAKRYFRQF
jgi:hypothetical protein